MRGYFEFSGNIKMVYLFQTFIKDNKSLQTGLQKLYGIGPKFSKRIAESLGISPKTKMYQLSQYQIQHLRRLILHEYSIGSTLKRDYLGNIRSLVQMSSYRGFRHIEGLPTRGQRTRDNAKTAKRLLNSTSSELTRKKTERVRRL